MRALTYAEERAQRDRRERMDVVMDRLEYFMAGVAVAALLFVGNCNG